MKTSRQQDAPGPRRKDRHTHERRNEGFEEEGGAVAIVKKLRKEARVPSFATLVGANRKAISSLSRWRFSALVELTRCTRVRQVRIRRQIRKHVIAHSGGLDSKRVDPSSENARARAKSYPNSSEKSG